MDEPTDERLTHLREALFAAISDSESVRKVWSELESEGYSLYLLLENGRLDDTEGESASPRAGSSLGDPVFQINGADLSFLRSVGIDPTRKQRRPKG